MFNKMPLLKFTSYKDKLYKELTANQINRLDILNEQLSYININSSELKVLKWPNFRDHVNFVLKTDKEFISVELWESIVSDITT